jgi:hypothetical protein
MRASGGGLDRQQTWRPVCLREAGIPLHRLAEAAETERKIPRFDEGEQAQPIAIDRASLSFRQSFVNHPTNLAELDDAIGLF